MEPFQVGCGHCLECLNVHRLQWTHRLLDELSCHDLSCFITLTYSETDGNLNPTDLKNFLKRLRKAIEPVRIRYYACGEYGSNFKRPHYHVAVFGFDFPDKIPFRRDRKGFYMSRSSLLESLWKFGFSSILPACLGTFNYVTKDMQKLLPPPEGKLPPFIRASNRPGIGANGWNRSLTDGLLWHDGRSVNLPRYYKKIALREGLDLSNVHRFSAMFAESRCLDDDRIKKSKNDLKKLLT